MSSFELPREIITDTKTKSVTVTPEIEAAIPGIEQAFIRADSDFENYPELYLQELEDSMFTFKSSEGSDVHCSYIAGENDDELLVVFAPFADRDPKTSAESIYRYISQGSSKVLPKYHRQAIYKPNTWNQTTKSAAVADLLNALDECMPVLTIYGPIHTHAYSAKERDAFRRGDFSPAGRLALEAIDHLQDRLHGPSQSGSRIETLNFAGASLGASNAIGAAANLAVRGSYNVPTVTAQELILGPKNVVPDLGKRFILNKPAVGEPSDETVSQSYPKIEETAMRKAIDQHGSEFVGMNARSLLGMSKLAFMKGLTKKGSTVRAINKLLSEGTGITVALSENSALTYQTPEYFFPFGKEHLITIRGEQGQTIGHLGDEHVALAALIVALGLRKRQDT